MRFLWRAPLINAVGVSPTADNKIVVAARGGEGSSSGALLASLARRRAPCDAPRVRAEILFRDEEGRQWKVVRAAGRIECVATLKFVSDAGEQRSCEVIALDDETWATLPERACRSLVRVARPVD
jgi:hypothetical protein